MGFKEMSMKAKNVIPSGVIIPEGNYYGVEESSVFPRRFLDSVRLRFAPSNSARNDSDKQTHFFSRWTIFLLFFFILPSSSLFAQTISGVINTYLHVIAVDT
ncbi:MAG TPA: hypothetical protein VFX22_02180, partial [Candidatus Kapabacteria bacterium]|nr:hypothetical protein [Candidatus Kapabacteria bacterium]